MLRVGLWVCWVYPAPAAPSADACCSQQRMFGMQQHWQLTPSPLRPAPQPWDGRGHYPRTDDDKLIAWPRSVTLEVR